MADEAKAKRHSTMAQAIEQGVKMRAKRTLLTHFSQRYPKLPVFDDGQNVDGVAVAFDGMRCNIGDMWRLGEYIGPLKELYREDVVVEEEQDAKE